MRQRRDRASHYWPHVHKKGHDMDNTSRIRRMADIPQLNATGRALARLIENVQKLRSDIETMLSDTGFCLRNAHELSGELDNIQKQLFDLIRVSGCQIVDTEEV